MGWGRSQEPAEAFAAEEQARADELARRCGEIASTPDHPSQPSLHHYQAAYQNASGNAAGHTSQPR
ncbi:hypothetical protein [Streptomyces albipurpureus]|uniref:Uncharacterized protein n=1 Tax=Streptomyces albipurpureus TaxID=2897419 RepID=A0ABT0UWX3_9ACTN|nr:hypothetical protein [Streptomyces sp. CWNU-1]MCM2393079.1 hypothetical protein [Streptomyces sp. CWNU-1]